MQNIANNGKQILIDTLKHKTTQQVAWVPFAGVHAGTLAGFNAEEILKDGEKLYKSLLEVNKLYRPCGQPVVFDLQIEAEILGCDLLWTHDGPPSVKNHPLEESKEIPCKCTIPTEKDGRLPMILDVMRRLKDAVGDNTALYGLICGPFTLASHLRGNEIFMDMYDDEEYVGALIGYCTDVAKAMTDMYLNAGMDVIAVVDPLVSQISPDHFDQFLNGAYTDIFAHIKSKGALSSFFVCGDATKNIEVMCKTSPDSISVDENVDIVAAKRITDRYNIAIGGNIPLTTVMLHGTQQDNMKYAMDLMDKIEDKRNFILAPGCDLPFATPIDNCIGVAQAAWQPEAVREMLKNYVSSGFDIDVELPDYNSLTKPLVEVFTLDSATCAACTYMMGAVDVAKEFYGDRIDVVEYKFTLKENIARCVKMGVKNLPCIYINGRLIFSSIIPSKEELNAAIEAAF